MSFLNTHLILKRKYLMAFLLIAVCTTAAQVLIQWSLYTQAGNSKVVNLAGRQRMLSQRVVKFALKIQLNRQSGLATETQETTMRESLEELKTTHINLRDGDTDQEIKASFTPEIKAAYDNLEQDLIKLQESAECVLENCDQSQEALIQLFEASEPFLTNMNLIVKMSELHARQDVVLLSRLEIGIYIAILLLMAYEIFFVMFPMNKMLADRLRDLSLHRQALYQKARLASIGELAGGVANEVNNPLAIIKGYLIALNKHASFLEDQTLLKSLSKIELASERITGIISGLKAFSRPGQGRPA
ncbi:MAG: type IV pili methyl-accepting chemotaxis transducer N-terminal domain-containing protein, partial [Pseudomonadota bacterium]